MTVLESEDTIETKDTVQVSEEAQPVDQEIEPNDSKVVNTEIKEQIIDESLPNKQEGGELQSEAVEESGALPPADGHEEAKVDLEEETLADANILQTNNNPQQTTIAKEVTKQTHDNISSNDNVNTEVKQTTQPSAEANEDVINSYRIFISKLAYEATHNDLQSYFSQFGNITDIHIPRYSGNPAVNKGYGFVSFDNEASLVKALNVSSHIILGREVVLHRAIGQKHPGGGKGADEAPHPVRDRYPRSKRQYEGNENYGSRYNKRGRDDRYRSEYYPPGSWQLRKPYASPKRISHIRSTQTSQLYILWIRQNGSLRGNGP
uniref:RNA recognition motif. (A.k.a. RRM, RBD, or RNP) domain containing protein n=1 Tax=Babesia bovis TaxID=5865 RepID=S6BNZ8_BABBO|nr:RNA recognition motif. (a.k.a. RRM, RBD, or RNP) domain containing protein [Babesia bovis]